MLMKVNQVTSPSQGAKSAADVLGVVFDGRSNWAIDVEALSALRSTTGAKISFALCRSMTKAAPEVNDILARFQPDFYEFTPADPAKPQQHRADLELLDSVSLPKIANGYFALRDDLSLLDDLDHFRRLMDVGVVLFQFEIDSLVHRDVRLRDQDAARLDDLFATVPALVCDSFENLDCYPLTRHRGYFLNLRSTGQDVNYDCSELSFSLPHVAQLGRSLRYPRPSR